MKRSAVQLLLLAGAALAQGRPEKAGRPGGTPASSRNSYANPSAVIAAEASLVRLAREKGQWTAFAATAAPDAVLFRPGMVYARDWLRGQLNPPVSVERLPYQVWSSCDGTLMISHGAWRQGAAFGSFTTVWQRQGDGQYKWVLDQNRATPQLPLQPEMISGFIADCPERAKRPAGGPPQGRDGQPKPENSRNLPPLDPSHRSGKSNDGTLGWDIAIDPTGVRTLTVSWTKGGADRIAFTGQTPPGAH